MKSSDALPHVTFASHGCATYPASVVRDALGGVDPTEWADLIAAFDALPLDPFADGASRCRRYARGVYLPWAKRLSWLPAETDDEGLEVYEYYQGLNNPEFAGARRRFAAIESPVRTGALLTNLVTFDAVAALQEMESLAAGPLHVGVHFVKLEVDQDNPRAVASPDALHQDGEPFTFAHLVKRDNVSGGINAIAEPRFAGARPDELSPHAIQAEFVLNEPLDSYGVRDDQVSHYVGHVEASDLARPGSRSVILIDFTPYVPLI